MGVVPSSAIPTLVKGLSRLNDDGEIVVDRDALAMLAAVDGRSTVQDIARVHGVTRTDSGLTRLLDLGAVRLETCSQRSPSEPVKRRQANALGRYGDEERHARARRPEGAFFRLWAVLALPAIVMLVAVFIIWNPRRSPASHAVVAETAIDDARSAVVATPQSAESPGTPAARCDQGAPCQVSVEVTTSEGYAPSAIASTTQSVPSAGPTDVARATWPGTSVATMRPTSAVGDGKSSGDSVTPPTPPVATPVTSIAAVPAAVIASTEARAAPRIVLDERFEDNHRGWPNDPSSTAWLGAGGYKLFAREPSRFVAVSAPGVRRVRDVSLTATFRKVGGPPGGGYGFVVRDQGSGARDGVNQLGRYYVLEVGDRGEIGMWRREEDHWVDIVSWSPSTTVRRGDEPNEVALRVTGGRFVFLVNGVEVIDQTDSAFAEGTVGVFVGGDGNEVVLEKLMVVEGAE